MNASEIELICGDLDSKIKLYYRGTYSLDIYLYSAQNILDFTSTNIVIFNNQKSGSPGAHWLLLYITPRAERVVFFDSFSKPPEWYSAQLADFIHGISSNAKAGLETSSYRLQGDTKICGLYCIFIARHLTFGERLQSIIDSYFTPIYFSENDSKVLSWFSHQPYGYMLKERCKGEKNPFLSYTELMNHGKSGTNWQFLFEIAGNICNYR